MSPSVAQNTDTARTLLPAIFRNPTDDDTCAVCATPVNPGYGLCIQCERQKSGHGARLADLVVPLTYAGPQNPQAQQDLRQYKDGTGANSSTALTRLSYLVWHGIHYHGACIERVAGAPVEAVTSVPSGIAGKRADGHPVEALTWFPGARRVQLVRVADAGDRRIRPESLRVTGEVTGSHVVVFDDTWTSGAAAQSSAIALKEAGATFVTVVVIGRWLSSGWDPTELYIKRHPGAEWSPVICPVTRGACPR